MEIHYVELTDSGRINDSIGNDQSREILIGDFSLVKELTDLTRYHYRSFYGKRIGVPYKTVLLYGRRIYLSSAAELQQFLRERFLIRSDDYCPICGEERGRHLRFCFTLGAGLPYDIYPCSKKCMNELTHNINIYREILTDLKHLPDVHEYPYPY